MRKKLLMSAAALLATVSLASAQGAGSANKGPSGDPGASQASKGPSGSDSRGNGQPQQKTQSLGKPQPGQDLSQKEDQKNLDRGQAERGSGNNETSARTQSEGDRGRSNSAPKRQSEQRSKHTKEKSEAASQEREKSSQDESKSEAKRKQDRKQAETTRDERQGHTTSGAQRQGDKPQGAQSSPAQSPQQSQSERSSGSAQDAQGRTGGQADRTVTNADAQAKGVSLTTQQQTKIQQTVLSRRDVPRVDRVNFSVSIGTAVPSSVEVVEVPPALIEIYPDWREHSYVVVHDEIVIVDDRRAIVAIIPTGSSRAAADSGTAAAADLGSDDIREVQLVLIERGFLDGEADGVFGPVTRDALIKFQREEGIEASGRIDIRTVETMNLSSKVNVKETEGQQPARAGSRPEQRPGSQGAQTSPQSDPRSTSTTGQALPKATPSGDSTPSGVGDSDTRSSGRHRGQGGEVNPQAPAVTPDKEN